MVFADVLSISCYCVLSLLTALNLNRAKKKKKKKIIIIIITSMYPQHIVHLVNQTIDWSKQSRALPHLMGISYATLSLSASVPQKVNDIFNAISMAQST